MNKNNMSIYEKTFRRFVISVLFVTIVTLILGGILYSLIHPMNYSFLVIVLLDIFSIVIVYIVPINYIKKLFKFHLIFVTFVLLITTVFYLSIGIASTFYWYISMPVCIYTVYSNKKAVQAGLYSFGFMLLAFILAFVVRYVFYNDDIVHFGSMPLVFALRSDMINAGSALLMVYLCLHYLHRFRQIEIAQLLASKDGMYNEKTTDLLNPDKEEEYKYEKIYNQIEEYFEKEQPYLNPELKIVQVANDLNINTVYIAKAIRMKKDLNFNNFVNSYRIDNVKELMSSNSRKYTLKYFYLSSGFKNQSSFNKAFKLKEGITPSEYFKQNELEKEN